MKREQASAHDPAAKTWTIRCATCGGWFALPSRDDGRDDLGPGSFWRFPEEAPDVPESAGAMARQWRAHPDGGSTYPAMGCRACVRSLLGLPDETPDATPKDDDLRPLPRERRRPTRQRRRVKWDGH